MAMNPGPVLLLASALALTAGPWSGFATSGSENQSAVQTPARAAPGPSVAPDAVSYEALLRAAGDGFDAAGLAALKRGVSLRGRDARGAAAAFGEAAARLPGLVDWATLLQAEALAKTGDTAAVRTLLDQTEPGLVAMRGWRSRVDACRSARSIRCAVAEAGFAFARAPDSNVRAAAASQLGSARLESGDTAGAVLAFRSAMETSPGTEPALDAARSLAGLRSATAEDRLAAGRVFFRHGNADRGTAGFNAYLAKAGGTASEQAPVRLELARALYAARRYAVVEPQLVALVRTAGAPATVAEAKVLLGRTRLRLGRTDAAIATLASAIEDPALPAPARAEGLFVLADAEDDRGAADRARALYLRLLDDHPGTAEAADAAMRLGGVAFAAHRFDDAAGIFDRFRAAHRDGGRAQQAAFWAGRAWSAAGDATAATVRFAEVRAMDPTSLYGLRAGEHLAEPLRARLAPSPAVDPVADALSVGAVRRAAALRDIGLADGATLELARARGFIGALDGGLYSVAEALHSAGFALDAVRLGREIQRNGDAWNERLLRIVYPLPFRDEILAAASRRGLDPWFVAGLIRQESLFLVDARSSAGAIGLMQVLPTTGRELARRDGLSGFAPAMLTDPAVNIRLGTLFVAELLERHGGRVPYALAAYNAGPSRVARWLRLPDNGDPDVFAERIPFPETRDYVRIVQQNARIYAELYGTPADGNDPTSD